MVAEKPIAAKISAERHTMDSQTPLFNRIAGTFDRKTKPQVAITAASKSLVAILIAMTITSCSSNKNGEQIAEPAASGNIEKRPDCIGSQSQNSKHRTISIVPQLAATKIYSNYKPILKALGEKMSICFKLKQAQSIPDFEANLEQSSYDYAFMNPYHQVINEKRYMPLITDNKRLLSGIIVTRKGGPIKNINDINNRELFLPSPNAFAASLLIRAYLTERGIHYRPIYVKTHQNVYRGVLVNNNTAGGGVNNTFLREPDQIKSEISIVFETPGFTAHPLSASTSISRDERNSFQVEFIRLSQDKELLPYLKKIQIPDPRIASYEKDYQPLKKLRLEKYVADQ